MQKPATMPSGQDKMGENARHDPGTAGMSWKRPCPAARARFQSPVAKTPLSANLLQNSNREAFRETIAFEVGMHGKGTRFLGKEVCSSSP
jgi:hypothetical protein